MPSDPNTTFKNQQKKFDLIATILVFFFAFNFLFCFNFIQIMALVGLRIFLVKVLRASTINAVTL